MDIIRDFSSLAKEHKGAVVALGNFDGVHLGHQTILKRCIELAKHHRSRSAVLTFEPHPREFFAPGSNRLRLYPLHRKIALLSELGIEILFLARFNRRLASMTAEAFIEELLCRQLAARHVVTGFNFAFGAGRQGNTDLLAQAATRHGFGFSAIPQVLDAQGEPVSSSAVRAALALGNVRKAAGLLGRPYRVEGRVRSGMQRGRTLGFPTANLSMEPLFKPLYGIYAARARIGDHPEWHHGVASLGIKPTFGAHAPLLEVHLFDVERDLYGERLCVEFIEFIREERRFDSAEALQAQMQVDERQVRRILHG